MKFISFFIFICVFSSLVIANTDSSIQQASEIKSLSNNEVSGYLNGKGMGFSKVAELNSFPGPRHVLDLASELNLSKQQINKTSAIYHAMKAKAKDYGKQFIEKEKEIENVFSNNGVDLQKLALLTKESAEIKAHIRLSHLEAHISQQMVLSKKQIEKYDQLRGYSGTHSHTHKHH